MYWRRLTDVLRSMKCKQNQSSNSKRFLKQLFCAAVSADNLHPRASARKVSSYKYGIAPYRPLI